MARQQYAGDSFVVNITPPARNAPHFPWVRVLRRQQTREHGKVALEQASLLEDGLPEPPDQKELDALAKRIGKAILAGSPITQSWMKPKKQP